GGRAALTRSPLTGTLPPSTASAASDRVLKKRAAHSHLSIRTRAASGVSLCLTESAYRSSLWSTVPLPALGTAGPYFDQLFAVLVLDQGSAVDVDHEQMKMGLLPRGLLSPSLRKPPPHLQVVDGRTVAISTTLRASSCSRPIAAISGAAVANSAQRMCIKPPRSGTRALGAGQAQTYVGWAKRRMWGVRIQGIPAAWQCDRPGSWHRRRRGLRHGGAGVRQGPAHPADRCHFREPRLQQPGLYPQQEHVQIRRNDQRRGLVCDHRSGRLLLCRAALRRIPDPIRAAT